MKNAAPPWSGFFRYGLNGPNGQNTTVTSAEHIGSGEGEPLDLKYLVRVRGASDGPLDDRVLEVKQVRELGAIDCISVSRGSDRVCPFGRHRRVYSGGQREHRIKTKYPIAVVS